MLKLTWPVRALSKWQWFLGHFLLSGVRCFLFIQFYSCASLRISLHFKKPLLFSRSFGQKMCRLLWGCPDSLTFSETDVRSVSVCVCPREPSICRSVFMSMSIANLYLDLCLYLFLIQSTFLPLHMCKPFISLVVKNPAANKLNIFTHLTNTHLVYLVSCLTFHLDVHS
jgi:hypothetical protein